MSSEPDAVSVVLAPVCRIGECVYLIGSSSAEDFERDFGHQVRRSLDLAVEDSGLLALQTSFAIDEAALLASWRIVGLDELSALLQLSAGSATTLLDTIFRFVAQTLGLRRDPVLRSIFASILSEDGLSRGRIVAHAIEGLDTAICEVPTRLRLARGGLVIAFADQLVLGAVETVDDIYGDDGGRKIAAVDCTRTLPEGSAIVLTARGIAIAEIELRSYADPKVFNDALAPILPDAVNLAAMWDEEACAALAAIGRREQAHVSVALPSQGFRFEITHAASMDHGFFVSGWFLDLDGLLEEVLVIDHGLDDPSLTERWMLSPARTEIAGDLVAVQQFHAFFERRGETAAPANIAFRLHLHNGESHLAYFPDCRRDKRSARAEILNSVVGGSGMSAEMLSRIFGPAVGRLQDTCNADQAVREVVDIGAPSSRRISLIIPLYREMRFMRSQLIAFNVDPFVQAHCQIVYVVDDPLIAQKVRNFLNGTPNVFSLDIRLVILERNGGYALANNFGVAQASGDVVVLMNSDVVPETPGWLEPMESRLAALPDLSVIGPKLLYADESLQHAGMYFFKLPTNGYWQNMHFYKGFGRNFGPANIERDVPAVTGALMVLRRKDFQSVGGFTTDYVIGDYEDSDLCLKLRAGGGRCLYMPSVALLHFERQSMPDSDVDAGSTIYNRALHSARWSETIERLMTEVSEVRHAI
ncbi:glycosyltransferase [Rhizobium sp.]